MGSKAREEIFLGLARERSLTVNPGEQPWCAVDAARNRREKTPISPRAVLTGWKGKEASYRLFFFCR